MTEILHKTLTRVEIKSSNKGQVSAVFATFLTRDSDNDVTLPSAFEDGAEVVISGYGHGSWGGALPVGKGRIRTTTTEAILDGQFFLDTTAGQDTFTVVKELGPQQEWSYGFDIQDAEPGKHEGVDVQFLKHLKVFEVSPVLRGAGVNTRTLIAKALAGGIDPDEATEVAAREYLRFVAGELHRTVAAELDDIRTEVVTREDLAVIRRNLESVA